MMCAVRSLPAPRQFPTTFHSGERRNLRPETRRDRGQARSSLQRGRRPSGAVRGRGCRRRGRRGRSASVRAGPRALDGDRELSAERHRCCHDCHGACLSGRRDVRLRPVSTTGAGRRKGLFRLPAVAGPRRRPRPHEPVRRSAPRGRHRLSVRRGNQRLRRQSVSCRPGAAVPAGLPARLLVRLSRRLGRIRYRPTRLRSRCHVGSRAVRHRFGRRRRRAVAPLRRAARRAGFRAAGDAAHLGGHPGAVLHDGQPAVSARRCLVRRGPHVLALLAGLSQPAGMDAPASWSAFACRTRRWRWFR